jgi:predicted Fe-S protein YdhL (DUF1289 family)
MTAPGPTPPHTAVASPCNRVCTLNDDSVCLGCGRTLDDITRWSTMTEADKARCVALAADRLRLMGRGRPT